uniref:Inactive dipeptidyl peptidase 10-like n=1 Tax=Neolamprologus brichardi TaxID=32507 RepID=A0A3Q4MMF7_NEOBR
MRTIIWTGSLTSCPNPVKGASTPEATINVGPIGTDRNWKGIGISLLVIAVVLSLIGLSIVLLSKDDGGKPFGTPLTLDDLFEKTFQIHDPDAKWISGEYVKTPEFRPQVRELNPPEVSDSVLQFASWGVRGQQLVYIFENNIYYQMDVQSSSWRLTSSGEEGVVFNGISDWLYEEMVLHTQVAHWWSPDGSRLAYLTINDSLVPTMFLPRFTGSLYPRGKEYPYPKMCQINPSVRLYVVTLDGSALTTELKPPDSFEKSEFYITMVKWVTKERLSVRWVNRAQNMSILSLCDVTQDICTKKHVMTSDKWLDCQREEPVFSKDCTTLFITMPLKHGGSGTFNHITMISNQSDSQEVNMRHLTSGSWEVSQILAYDEGTNSVYYLSTETGATQRHLYSISNAMETECLTCSLFKSACSYYDAVLSPNYQHVLLNCRGSACCSNTITKCFISRLRYLNLCDFTMYLYCSSSCHFALDEEKEYPLLLVLDSTPGGQAVSDRFSLSWDSVLVSSNDVIVAHLDGRGSGCQGQRILHEVFQRLGTVDVHDQLTALEHLVKLPYIDANRVGVYGKAYGGFLSTLLVLSHPSVLRCGIAVAPITNWRLYGKLIQDFTNNIVTSYSYDCSHSVIIRFNLNIPLNFLIIHGTADANVHFQHSAELVKLLSASNVNYTLQIFPDEGHNIISVRSQHYFLSSVLNFFNRCFEEGYKEDD